MEVESVGCMVTSSLNDSYQIKEDAELVQLANSGDKLALSALVRRYEPFIKRRYKKMLSGYIDGDDLVQEGLIGLYDAIKTFNSDVGCKFIYYAKKCVANRIINVVKKQQCKKYIPDKLIMSLEGSDDNDGIVCLAELLCDETNQDPEVSYIEKESLEILRELIREKLSDMEYEVFMLFKEKLSYQEIARRLDISEKAVDNAIQRIRNKICNSDFEREYYKARYNKY